MIPVWPFTGKTWQRSGELDRAGWAKVLTWEGETAGGGEAVEGLCDSVGGWLMTSIPAPAHWPFCVSVCMGITGDIVTATPLASGCCSWFSVSTSLACCPVESGGMWAVNGLSAVWRMTLVAMALHCDPATGSWEKGGAGFPREEVTVPGCKPTWLAFLPGKAEHSLGCGKTDRGPEKVWTVVVEVSAKLGL